MVFYYCCCCWCYFYYLYSKLHRCVWWVLNVKLYLLTNCLLHCCSWLEQCWANSIQHVMLNGSLCLTSNLFHCTAVQRLLAEFYRVSSFLQFFCCCGHFAVLAYFWNRVVCQSLGNIWYLWFVLSGGYNYLHVEKPACSRKPLAELATAADYVSWKCFFRFTYEFYSVEISLKKDVYAVNDVNGM